MFHHMHFSAKKEDVEVKSLKQLRGRLRENLKEREKLLAQLEDFEGRSKRGSRRAFTKKILDRVEAQFPSGLRPRQRRRQMR